MNKQPRLGQKVFLVFDDFIVKDTVVMKGKDSFAVNMTFSNLTDDPYRMPIDYDDYGIVWFTKLKDAKESITLDENEIIIRIDDDYWEVWKDIAKEINNDRC